MFIPNVWLECSLQRARFKYSGWRGGDWEREQADICDKCRLAPFDDESFSSAGEPQLARTVFFDRCVNRKTCGSLLQSEFSCAVKPQRLRRIARRHRISGERHSPDVGRNFRIAESAEEQRWRVRRCTPCRDDHAQSRDHRSQQRPPQSATRAMVPTGEGGMGWGCVVAYVYRTWPGPGLDNSKT